MFLSVHKLSHCCCNQVICVHHVDVITKLSHRCVFIKNGNAERSLNLIVRFVNIVLGINAIWNYTCKECTEPNAVEYQKKIYDILLLTRNKGKIVFFIVALYSLKKHCFHLNRTYLYKILKKFIFFQ